MSMATDTRLGTEARIKLEKLIKTKIRTGGDKADRNVDK